MYINLGMITTIAGTGTSGYSGDNVLAKVAKLYYPSRISFSSNNDLYIADTYNHRIRKVSGSTGLFLVFT